MRLEQLPAHRRAASEGSALRDRLHCVRGVPDHVLQPKSERSTRASVTVGSVEAGAALTATNSHSLNHF